MPPTNRMNRDAYHPVFLGRRVTFLAAAGRAVRSEVAPYQKRRFGLSCGAKRIRSAEMGPRWIACGSGDRTDMRGADHAVAGIGFVVPKPLAVGAVDGGAGWHGPADGGSSVHGVGGVPCRAT